MINKYTIIELIGKNKFDDSFKHLLIHFNKANNIELYKSKYKKAQQLRARHESLKKQQLDDTISVENFNTTKNKLTKAIIEFVDTLPDQFWNPELNKKIKIVEKENEHIPELKEYSKTTNDEEKPTINFPFIFFVIVLLLLTFALPSYFFHEYNKLELDRKNILTDKAWKIREMTNGAKFNLDKLEIESTVCNYAQFIQEIGLKSHTNYQIQYSIKTRNVLEICQGEKAGSNKWGAGVWINDEDNQLSEHVSYYNTNKCENV